PCCDTGRDNDREGAHDEEVPQLEPCVGGETRSHGTASLIRPKPLASTDACAGVTDARSAPRSSSSRSPRLRAAKPLTRTADVDRPSEIAVGNTARTCSPPCANTR